MRGLGCISLSMIRLPGRQGQALPSLSRLTWFGVKLEVHAVHVRELPLQQVLEGAVDVGVIVRLRRQEV